MINTLRRLRHAFTSNDPLAGWPELQSKSFHALLRHVAGFVMNEDAREAVEEVIAAQGRELLDHPDPTDHGNPFSFMAWIAANHAQTVRDQKNLLRSTIIVLLTILPILCAIASFAGVLLAFALSA